MSLVELAISSDEKRLKRLARQVNVLRLSPRQKRKLLKKIGSKTIKKTRQNIRGQKTITGSKMEGRAGKQKKRMFRKLGKNLTTKITDQDSAIVTWKHAGQAKVAYRHHHGIPEKMTAGKAKKIGGVPDYKQKATKAQARALNQAGFRARFPRKKGKGGAILKKVSQKWIMENLTMGQSGMILRLLRDGDTKGKQSWQIRVPARPVLGATPEETKKYLNAMADEALRDIKRA